MTLAGWCANLDRALGRGGQPRSAGGRPGCGGCTWPGRGSAFERNEIQLHQMLGVRLGAHGEAGMPLRAGLGAARARRAERVPPGQAAGQAGAGGSGRGAAVASRRP